MHQRRVAAQAHHFSLDARFCLPAGCIQSIQPRQRSNKPVGIAARAYKATAPPIHPLLRAIELPGLPVRVELDGKAERLPIQAAQHHYATRSILELFNFLYRKLKVDKPFLLHDLDLWRGGV